MFEVRLLPSRLSWATSKPESWHVWGEHVGHSVAECYLENEAQWICDALNTTPQGAMF